MARLDDGPPQLLAEHRLHPYAILSASWVLAAGALLFARPEHAVGLALLALTGLPMLWLLLESWTAVDCENPRDPHGR